MPKSIIIILVIAILCTSCDPPVAVTIVPSPPCQLLAGSTLPLSVQGSYPANAVIEWTASDGTITPPTGVAVVYQAPINPGTVIVSAAITNGNDKTTTNISCTVTAMIPTLSPTVTVTTPAMSSPTPPQLPEPPCANIPDFTLISPTGLHGDRTVGDDIPQLNEHASILWCPPDKRMDVALNVGGVEVRKYSSKLSGEIDTAFLMNDYNNGKSLKYGDWVEIKIWEPKAATPSDNLHIKLPDFTSLPCSKAMITSPAGANTNSNTLISWTPASCYLKLQIYQNGKLVQEFSLAQSGTINTQSLELHGQIEIKTWMPGAGKPTNNVFVNLP
jgi:hypothetical protein